uniref:RRM domain-containing protein n=1 Tax=Ascaris lumbricoides TaxID=6252 RepID=A0A0M3I8M9_ASCLU
MNTTMRRGSTEDRVAEHAAGKNINEGCTSCVSSEGVGAMTTATCELCVSAKTEGKEYDDINYVNNCAGEDDPSRHRSPYNGGIHPVKSLRERTNKDVLQAYQQLMKEAYACCTGPMILSPGIMPTQDNIASFNFASSASAQANAQQMANAFIEPNVCYSEIILQALHPAYGVPRFWSGEIPPRTYSNPTFSSKVFVGGVPWDITEQTLLQAFRKYGKCKVEWPTKEVCPLPRMNGGVSQRTKATGYVYIVLEHESCVGRILRDCTRECDSAGEWYFKITATHSDTPELRKVEIIPWVISDATYTANSSVKLDWKKTVFVGALHGMITARVLHAIMTEVYGNVVSVTIDTDRHKYPIGSGRVTFSSRTSYFRAIDSAFLEIRTSKFSKRVQIDPFLEDSPCSLCVRAHGSYFCRDRSCFNYYCFQCWQMRHCRAGPCGMHTALMRRPRRSSNIRYRDDTAHSSLITYCPFTSNQQSATRLCHCQAYASSRGVGREASLDTSFGPQQRAGARVMEHVSHLTCSPSSFEKGTEPLCFVEANAYDRSSASAFHHRACGGVNTTRNTKSHTSPGCTSVANSKSHHFSSPFIDLTSSISPANTDNDDSPSTTPNESPYRA